MASQPVVNKAPSEDKKKRHRSPNFPTASLADAVDRTKRFVTANGKAGAMPAMATKLIGFASAHGQAYSVLSALKKFGLLEEKDGRVAPTQRAMEIVSLPDSDPRRLKAIKDAAVAPAIYAELIDLYKDTNLPNDETLAGELIAYKGFNPNSVTEFLKAFRETLDFAGLSDLSVLGSEKQEEKGDKQKPKIGQWVQWEHNGILGLPQSKRLVGFSEDGQVAFVEGSMNGLPVSEIILADPPAQSPPTVPPRTLVRMPDGRSDQGAKMRQDVFSLAEGEAVIHWPDPLSADSINDLEEWLELVKRKIKRSAAESPQNPAEMSRVF
jgi:hypothetical protein